jgi:hypothetical protein
MASRRSKKVSRKYRTPQWVTALIEDARLWCSGRIWLPRLLLLLYMCTVLVSHLKNPVVEDIFKPLNLCLHEMGHLLAMPCGEFICVLAGSLFQCFVPVMSCVMFMVQRDYFAIVFCFGWLSTNLFDVATYIDDARRLELPLVSPMKGDEPIHDWNYILSHLHLLRYDNLIAGCTRGFAILSMLVFIALGGWLVYTMITAGGKKKLSAIDKSLPGRL